MHLPLAEDLVVLEELDRSDEGVIAAGHDADDAIFEVGQPSGEIGMLPAEVLAAFPPRRFQQYAQAARRPAARKADPPIFLDRPPQGSDQLRELGPCEHLLRLGNDIAIDRLKHEYGGRGVALGGFGQSACFGIGLLRRQHAQVELLFVFDELAGLAMGLAATRFIKCGGRVISRRERVYWHEFLMRVNGGRTSE